MQANIGNGVSENSMGKPVTVASSKTSPKKGKRSTKSTKQPITQGEALEMLASALNYCQQAGLSVTGYNETNGLVLFIEGVVHSGKEIVVTKPKPVQQSNDKALEKVTT